MLGCSSPEISQWDRKNYFYPDMAKNYQTSQLDLPLCLGGEVPLYPWSYPNDVIKSGIPLSRTVKLTASIWKKTRRRLPIMPIIP